jgi:hypothetical protein
MLTLVLTSLLHGVHTGTWPIKEDRGFKFSTKFGAILELILADSVLI